MKIKIIIPSQVCLVKLIKFSKIFQNELEFSSERITNQWSHVHLLHHERVLHWVGAFKHSTTLCISMMHKLTGNNGFTGISFLFSCLLSHRAMMKQWRNGNENFFPVDGTYFCNPLQDSSGLVNFQSWTFACFNWFQCDAESRYSTFVNLCRKQSRAQWNRVISSYQK